MTSNYHQISEKQNKILQKVIQRNNSRLSEKFKTRLVLLLLIIELTLILLIAIFEDNEFSIILKLLIVLPLTIIVLITIMHFTGKSTARKLNEILMDIDNRKAFQIFNIKAKSVEKHIYRHNTYYLFIEEDDCKVIINERDLSFDNKYFPNDNFGLIHEELHEVFGNKILIFGNKMVPRTNNKNKINQYFRKYGKPIE